jgi:hypothetical protein
MESRNRDEVITIRELLVSEDEMPTVEAVVAAYQNGYSADFLRSETESVDGVYAFDMNHRGSMIISGLRQARAGRAAGIDNVFELSDEQREQATKMLEGYEKTLDN